MDFNTVLPRLVATYQAGRLVPFIGSGMSRPACTGWYTMVHRLEAAACPAGARLPEAPTASSPREELVRRANAAVRNLKSGAAGGFNAALEGAVFEQPGTPPRPTSQTLALARLWWPLVLTTNYDRLFARAYLEQENRELATVGRSGEDCQRVLNSLTVAGRSLLWALQGYLGADKESERKSGRTPDPTSPERDLRPELVVGHEEYRRVTYRDIQFRRAFAEVFRHRSLLFLGSGIQETYLQELFGEILELYGPSTRPHYAFMPRGEVDPEFMLARFQIVVVEFDPGAYGELERRLTVLADEVGRPGHTAVGWRWGRIRQQGAGAWQSESDLEIVRGPLPGERIAGDCLAVSAGGSGSAFFHSRGIASSALRPWGVPENAQPALVPPFIGEYTGLDAFAVRARLPDADERSLAHIYKAAVAFFDHVGNRGYRRIHMQLLATGGVDKQADAAAWQVRQYPERFSLIQIVRAWARWREANPTVPTQLRLCVVQEAVYHDITSGRIDVLELLGCRDIRFFAEVVGDGGIVERRLFQTTPDQTLGSITREMQLAFPHLWQCQVTPPPSLDELPPRPLSEQLNLGLDELGVVPGSTIHFRRAP